MQNLQQIPDIHLCNRLASRFIQITQELDLSIHVCINFKNSRGICLVEIASSRPFQQDRKGSVQGSQLVHFETKFNLLNSRQS